MGVAERKAKEKEELRNHILAAAMRLFAEKGVDNVTIRNIADAAEYSVGTVYVYFKDKSAILHALHTQGFSDLRSRFQILTYVADPMERLKASGHVYVQFAVENPHMYQLMFSVADPIDHVECAPDGKWHEGQSTFNFLRDMVQACVDAGHFSGHQPVALAYLIWGAVHGICSLSIMKRASVTELNNPVGEGLTEFLRMLDRL
ncbi:TetR family transcriptional regulator [Rudanella paleaurantiibacter]|uniref:TetR family transcriptional regulator n=1 Tax=Rudanella paleaurantiibacter TaxID=2614655 RepID=A0A7J5TTQ3_9BACT|nr:TetR/AcrR family transcriptional regulator [Rudanella paleaurantiibacter]KAB7727265.1 TetR family transcriptional regulator [Rudanella paleaurantiibacter]